MIILAKGNLLRSEADVLVNTVNCVGFMGKGIALQFRKAFPENFKAYETECRKGNIVPGKVFLFSTGNFIPPLYIINFPTKKHWRENSKIEYITSGLEDLVKVLKELDVSSVAVPPLGCGLGGLKWSVVRPLIERAFSNLPDLDVYLFQPSGTPEADNMPINTRIPQLTRNKAMLLLLMDRYCVDDYSLSLLEVHKLAYFLQEAGENINLEFVENTYGPYSKRLSHMLQDMDGHYISGCGDDNHPWKPITVLPQAVNSARALLSEDEAGKEHLEKVFALIDGFETPFGMELLASVHWVSSDRGCSIPAVNDKEAYLNLSAWNDRKRRLFDEYHVIKAFERLRSDGWLKTISSPA